MATAWLTFFSLSSRKGGLKTLCIQIWGGRKFLQFLFIEKLVKFVSSYIFSVVLFLFYCCWFLPVVFSRFSPTTNRYVLIKFSLAVVDYDCIIYCRFIDIMLDICLLCLICSFAHTSLSCPNGYISKQKRNKSKSRLSRESVHGETTALCRRKAHTKWPFDSLAIS